MREVIIVVHSSISTSQELEPTCVFLILSGGLPTTTTDSTLVTASATLTPQEALLAVEADLRLALDEQEDETVDRVDRGDVAEVLAAVPVVTTVVATAPTLRELNPESELL